MTFADRFGLKGNTVGAGWVYLIQNTHGEETSLLNIYVVHWIWTCKGFDRFTIHSFATCSCKAKMQSLRSFFMASCNETFWDPEGKIFGTKSPLSFLNFICNSQKCWVLVCFKNLWSAQQMTFFAMVKIKRSKSIGWMLFLLYFVIGIFCSERIIYIV